MAVLFVCTCVVFIGDRLQCPWGVRACVCACGEHVCVRCVRACRTCVALAYTQLFCESREAAQGAGVGFVRACVCCTLVTLGCALIGVYTTLLPVPITVIKI